MSDPTNLAVINEVKFITGYGVRVALAHSSAIKRILDQRRKSISDKKEVKEPVRVDAASPKCEKAMLWHQKVGKWIGDHKEYILGAIPFVGFLVFVTIYMGALVGAVIVVVLEFVGIKIPWAPVGFYCGGLLAGYAVTRMYYESYSNSGKGTSLAVDSTSELLSQQRVHSNHSDEALAAHEEAERFGSQDPHLASSVHDMADWESNNNAGFKAYQESCYADGDKFFQAALEKAERLFGPQDLATYLYILGELYYKLGRYSEAEPLYLRSLAIREKALGAEHPEVAETFDSLALLYHLQGRYEEAEPLFRRSLVILEKVLGPDHHSVGISLNNLATLYESQKRYSEAEPLYLRSLAIIEKDLGPEDPNVALTLNNLATLYYSQNKPAEAELLYLRSLAIWEKASPEYYPSVAGNLNNLAALYKAQGKYSEAEPLYKRSLAIKEKALGPEHSDVAQALENYATLLRKTNRDAEATRTESRATAIRAVNSQKNLAI